MDFHLLLRNRNVSRVLVGVPDGHQHIRARIETAGGDVITLQEATLAAIARAYLAVSTHPTRNAVELRAMEISGRKRGFAEVQLLETDADEDSLRSVLASPPPERTPDGPPTASVDTMPLSPETEAAAPVPASPIPVEPEMAATDHGAPPDDDAVDLDLDDPLEEDDGPVFGDVPTMHSRPPGEDEP